VPQKRAETAPNRDREFATIAYGTAIRCMDALSELRPAAFDRGPFAPPSDEQSRPITDDGGQRATAFAATMIAWGELCKLRDEDESRWLKLVQDARRTYSPDAPSCRLIRDLPGSPTMLENIVKLLGLRLRQLVYFEGRSAPNDLGDTKELHSRLTQDWRDTAPELRLAVLTILATTIGDPEEVSVQLIRESAGLVDLSPSTDGPSSRAEPLLPLLSAQACAIRDILLGQAPEEPLTGSALCEEYEERTKKGLDEGALRSRIIPKLAAWGLKNEPKLGYYFPEDSAARAVARIRRG
jgi:hypothetical protein